MRSLLVATVLGLATVAQAQESKSAQLAGELSKALSAAKLDSIAAKLGPDQYVAALYFTGSQLLVVKARYIVPERMDASLAAKSYRDIYVDLNSASVAGSKTLVADFGADGLQPRRRDNKAADTADVAGKSVSFDGEWGRAKLSEQEYMQTFQATDTDYAHMLEALLAQLKKAS